MKCMLQFYDSSHRKLQRRKPLSYYQISTGIAVTIQSAAAFLALQRQRQRARTSVDRVRARKRSRPTALSEARLRVSMMPQRVQRALVEEMRAQAMSGGDEMERLLAASPSDESSDDD